MSAQLVFFLCPVRSRLFSVIFWAETNSKQKLVEDYIGSIATEFFPTCYTILKSDGSVRHLEFVSEEGREHVAVPRRVRGSLWKLLFIKKL